MLAAARKMQHGERMKRGTLATVLSLLGLLAAPAGAQTLPPGVMPQSLPGADPYAVPQPQDEAPPPNAYDPNAPYDPNVAYDPNAFDPNAYEGNGVDPNQQAVPNLGPDNDIAQTYDDGYDPQAYTQFQDALTPYGTWTDDDSYGEVWTPAASIVGNNFMPYASCGHWIRSEYGWTWVSDWNWGWAPFHYGRWIARAGRWSWVPGTMWGPAWVSWRSGDGYVGWTPLPPRGVRLAAWTRAGTPWRFTATGNLGAPRLTFLAPRYYPQLFARTTVVSTDRLLTHGNFHVRVNAGPVRGVTAPIVPLTRVAPAVMPRVTVYPHAGVPVYARPWVRRPEAQRDPLTNGWHDGTTVLSSHPTFGRSAPSVSRPAFEPRPMPAPSAPAYGRSAPSFAGRPSPVGSPSFAPHPGFQPPANRMPAPTARPSYQPPGGVHAYAPRAFAPPPGNSGFRPAQQSGGFHPGPPSGGGYRPAPPSGGGFRPAAPSGGGFHPAAPSGGGFHAAAPSGGGFHPAPPSGGGFHAPSGGGFHAPSGGGSGHFGGGGAHFGGGGSHHR